MGKSNKNTADKKEDEFLMLMDSEGRGFLDLFSQRLTTLVVAWAFLALGNKEETIPEDFSKAN